MKKTLLFGFASLAVTLLLAACATKPQYKLTAPGDYDSAFEYLSGYIESEMKNSKVVGLSVAVVSDKEVLWTQGFGYADKANDIKVTPQTMFDPASASKMFTATAVMQLVEQGKIDLDKSFSTYLPEFSMKSRFTTSSDDITVRHIMAHHSGMLGDYFDGMLSKNPEAFTKYRDRFLEDPKLLQNEYISWPPEYTHAYSNEGYTLLGNLIDRVSGSSFFDYTEAELLEKIGMVDSTFNLTPDLVAQMPKGYMNGKIIDLPQLYEKHIPAGGLMTNAEELTRFMMAYLDEEDTRLLKPETKEEMYTRQNAHVKRDLDFAQGLGWMISDFGFIDAGRIVFHDGSEAFSNAKMVLLLDQNIGIAILTNSVEGDSAKDTIAKEIIRATIETKTGTKPKEYRHDPPATRKASGEELARLDGHYVYPSLGLVTLETRKSKLMAKSGGMKMELVPYENGRFGLKPLLFGFIPIKIPYLDTLEFSFEEVEGDMLSAMYSDGTPLLAVGLRVEQPQLDETWLNRKGTYEAIELGDDFPIISPWEVVEREGFLFIDGSLYGILPFSLMLTPANNDYAFWGGIGRGSGETFTFEEREGDTFILYAGYTYLKIK